MAEDGLLPQPPVWLGLQVGAAVPGPEQLLLPFAERRGVFTRTPRFLAGAPAHHATCLPGPEFFPPIQAPRSHSTENCRQGLG